jgi:CRISPR system Cascade subunit CasE
MEILSPFENGEAMSIGHRLMWTVMPRDIQQSHDKGRSPFLWRSAGDNHKYYLLGPKPVEESPLFGIETKAFEPNFTPGDRLAFDLRVNATVDRKTGEVNGKAVRTRVDVAFDLMRSEERDGIVEPRARRRFSAATTAIRDWLDARADQSGFRLIASDLVAYRTETLPRRGCTAKFGVFDVTGILEVAEPGTFLRRLIVGFGRAKAFGCGLMLLKRTYRHD